MSVFYPDKKEKTMAKKTKTQGPTEKALKIVAAAMAWARKRGIKLVAEDWGVQYNAEKKKFETSENNCACAFGAYLVCKNPKVTKTELANVYGTEGLEDLNDAVAYNPIIEDGDFLVRKIGQSLGLTAKQIERFIKSYDRGKNERDKPKSVIDKNAYKLRDKYAPEEDNGW